MTPNLGKGWGGEGDGGRGAAGVMLFDAAKRMLGVVHCTAQIVNCELWPQTLGKGRGEGERDGRCRGHAF